jgi:hypothetical protein
LKIATRMDERSFQTGVVTLARLQGVADRAAARSVD